MKQKHRRLVAVAVAFLGVLVWLVMNPENYEQEFYKVENEGESYGVRVDGEDEAVDGDVADGNVADGERKLAIEVLELLEVKGRAPKTGYTREQFYDGWPVVDGCSLRQRIIKREFGETAILEGCDVVAGEYDEPYTGQHLTFQSKKEIADGVQIDHVVALSDAWQKGAQYKDQDTRYKIATDPLNLLAVEATANKNKSDGDAATWLPANKKFRCQYVARQVSVKYKYALWVTLAEKEAIKKVLGNCPNELAVGL